MEILDRPAVPAPLLLRHRLFPRAMAWDLHQNNSGQEITEEPRLHKAARVESTRSTSPFANESAPTLPFNAIRPPSADSRERLFRTIGKWLDTPRDAPHQHQHQHADTYYRYYERQQTPPSPTTSSYTAYPRQESGGLYDMVKLGASIHSPTHSHPSPTHSTASSTSKKRQRGPSGSTAPTVGVINANANTNNHSVARPGMSTSSAKRCSVDACGKIAVSKGLCRGHGGGRRCTFTGCTKCAQSRSPFCWAHGGGKRCEAPNCRRSRKTKRFCVDHVDMEATVPLPSDSDDSGEYHSHANSDTETNSSVASSAPPTTFPAPTVGVGALHLPSLSDALKRAVPAAVARATAARTVSLPQSYDRLFPQQQTTAAAVGLNGGRAWM